MASRTTDLTYIDPILADCPELSLTDSQVLYGSQFQLPLLEVQGARSRSVIALQGAQLLSHQTDAGELLWLSNDCSFEPGLAIRGGIPLCLPWFGPHAEGGSYPKHGLARLQNWRLESAVCEEGVVVLRFDCLLKAGGGVVSDTTARLSMRLSDRVEMSLEVLNSGQASLPLSFAFHSYFKVSDARQAEVDGLDGHDYLDNTQQLKPQQQQSRIGFGVEVDRVYESAAGSQCLLGDTAVTVEGDHCPTVIVWNPGPELAASMADVGEGWRHFVCVERGAAFKDRVSLPPGASYMSRMTIVRES